MISGEVLNELLQTYGLLGVFLVSLLGNMIPYSTIPYFVFIIIYASRVQDWVIQLLIAILGGLGAAIGKLVVYYIGRTARVVMSSETRHNMELFTKIAGKGIFLAVFIFAALPLPDDVLYVPLGVSGYSVIKFFIALLLGKIIITGMAVYLGQAMKWLIEEPANLPWYISIPVMLIITLLLTYIVMRINWIKAAQITEEDGLIKAIIFIIIEALKIVASIPRLVYEKFRDWIEKPDKEAQPVDPSS